MEQTPTPPVPDPNGPPTPRHHRLRQVAENGVRMVVWCGIGLGTLTIVATLSKPTSGATRSSHLILEQRQKQIDTAKLNVCASEPQP
jgi:hypothetical protein